MSKPKPDWAQKKADSLVDKAQSTEALKRKIARVIRWAYKRGIEVGVMQEYERLTDL